MQCRVERVMYGICLYMLRSFPCFCIGRLQDSSFILCELEVSCIVRCTHSTSLGRSSFYWRHSVIVSSWFPFIWCEPGAVAPSCLIRGRLIHEGEEEEEEADARRRIRCGPASLSLARFLLFFYSRTSDRFQRWSPAVVSSLRAVSAVGRRYRSTWPAVWFQQQG